MDIKRSLQYISKFRILLQLLLIVLSYWPLIFNIFPLGLQNHEYFYIGIFDIIITLIKNQKYLFITNKNMIHNCTLDIDNVSFIIN